MSEQFEVTSTPGDGGLVQIVKVLGELDSRGVPAFQKLVEGLIAAGHTRLIVDCSELDYISSSGLLILQKMVNLSRDRGGDLHLAALNEKNFTILDLLGFSQLIRCFDSVDRATAAF